MQFKDQKKYLRRKLGQHLNLDDNSTLAKQVKNHVKRMRLSIAQEALGVGGRGTYGGLSEWAEKLEKDYLVAQGTFDEHAVYLLAPPVIDALTHRVVVALSTENLLLNAYRQAKSGLPSYIMVDTTHRLIVEGHNCMLVGTTDAAQHFHIIGYGICSHEDLFAHEVVLSAIREQVNAVVLDRQERQVRI